MNLLNDFRMIVTLALAASRSDLIIKTKIERIASRLMKHLVSIEDKTKDLEPAFRKLEEENKILTEELDAYKEKASIFSTEVRSLKKELGISKARVTRLTKKLEGLDGK